VGLVPTDAEKVALYDSMFAYAGTYTVDQEKVSHHIGMSWNQAWTGTVQVQFLRLEEDRLTYTSVPARSPMTGRDCVHSVVVSREAAGDGGEDAYRRDGGRRAGGIFRRASGYGKPRRDLHRARLQSRSDQKERPEG